MDIAITMNHAFEVKYWEDWRELLAEKTPINQYLKVKFSKCFELVNNKRIKFVYFGNSFCQYDIPNIDEIQTIIHFTNVKNLKLILVTPPVTDYGIEKVKKIFEYFGTERFYGIVINDLGILELLKEYDYDGEIIFGRIMDKTIREVRLTDSEKINYYSTIGFGYMSTVAYTAEPFKEFLAENGIKRVQVDCSNIKIENNKSLYCDIIYPSEYVTTGRMCLFRIAGQNEDDKFLLNNECKKICMFNKQYMTQMVNHVKIDSTGNRIRELQMIRKGNTLFYLNDISVEEMECDRLVIDFQLLF